MYLSIFWGVAYTTTQHHTTPLNNTLGFTWDYVFDWTIMKYAFAREQQSTTTAAPAPRPEEGYGVGGPSREREDAREPGGLSNAFARAQDSARKR